LNKLAIIITTPPTSHLTQTAYQFIAQAKNQGVIVIGVFFYQSADMLHIKNFLKTFAAFEFYDIDNIFVCEKSLKERGLPLKFHIDDVKLLNEQSLSVCLQHHDIILRF